MGTVVQSIFFDDEDPSHSSFLGVPFFSNSLTEVDEILKGEIEMSMERIQVQESDAESPRIVKMRRKSSERSICGRLQQSLEERRLSVEQDNSGKGMLVARGSNTLRIPVRQYRVCMVRRLPMDSLLGSGWALILQGASAAPIRILVHSEQEALALRDAITAFLAF